MQTCSQLPAPFMASARSARAWDMPQPTSTMRRAAMPADHGVQRRRVERAEEAVAVVVGARPGRRLGRDVVHLGEGIERFEQADPGFGIHLEARDHPRRVERLLEARELDHGS